jgi:hypothetical protein
MFRRMTTLTLLLSAAVVGRPTDALALGRLAAIRAARAEAAEAAVKTASLKAPAAMQTVAMQPAAPAQPMPYAEPVMPVIAGCGTCCPQPCIIYRHHGHHRRTCCDCCTPPIETVLTATNPCTCCPVAIPVCVPGCCTCAPTVSCHDGLLCAGVVHYDWSCGYRVTVRFKHNGDVVVVSRG